MRVAPKCHKEVKMPRITIAEDICKGCWLCVRICPQKVIKKGEHLNSKGFYPATYIGEGCTGCRSCALTCPDIAITVYK